MPAPAPKLLSFAEFCDQRALKAGMRAAFQVDVRQTGGTFNFRTEVEWDQQFQLFTQADRRRRTHHG